MHSLLDTAQEVWRQLHLRVGTGKLNQALESWIAHYRLPVRGKNYKIRFVTQVSANPVRFIAFVNRLAGFPHGLQPVPGELHPQGPRLQPCARVHRVHPEQEERAMSSWSIGEVARFLGVRPHVIRYWESELPLLSPRKGLSGRREYSAHEIQLLLRFRDLLYETEIHDRGGEDGGSGTSWERAIRTSRRGSRKSGPG